MIRRRSTLCRDRLAFVAITVLCWCWCSIESTEAISCNAVGGLVVNCMTGVEWCYQFKVKDTANVTFHDRAGCYSAPSNNDDNNNNDDDNNININEETKHDYDPICGDSPEGVAIGTEVDNGQCKFAKYYLKTVAYLFILIQLMYLKHYCVCDLYSLVAMQGVANIISGAICCCKGDNCNTDFDKRLGELLAADNGATAAPTFCRHWFQLLLLTPMLILGRLLFF